jgi:hypothetical protein
MAETAPDEEGRPEEAPADLTLAGYLEMHDRPPAFEGSDGHPYTVSMEVERTGDLRAPYHAYLVFPRWAQNGVGIVGHAESPTLAQCRSSEEADGLLGALTLHQVREILEDVLSRAAADEQP